MKKKSASVGELIKGFIVLGLCAVLLLWAIQVLLDIVAGAINKIAQITSNLDAVIIVALITGGVSIAGVVVSSIVSKVLEYRQATKRYLYEKREEPYSQFVEMVYKLQQKSKSDDAYTEEDMAKDILQFSKKLTLWGSNRVIKKWLQFRADSQSAVADSTGNLFILEDIIFEIRKDMGQRKGLLDKGDLLAFFINDIKAYVRK